MVRKTSKKLVRRKHRVRSRLPIKRQTGLKKTTFNSRVARVHNALNLASMEKKILTCPIKTVTLRNLAGSKVNGPKNSIILQCQGFSPFSQALLQGTGSDECIGSWITPMYGINHKFEMDFSGLVPTHADSKAGFNIDVYVINVRVSGNKSGLTGGDNFATWSAEMENILQSEIYEAGFDSDYLEYTEKNRNVSVVSRWRVKASQDRKFSIQAGDIMCAPPKRYTVTHSAPAPGKKQRLTATTDDPAVFTMNDTHQPCVLIMCDELTANTGTVAVRHTSRMYFTDA